MCVTKSRKSLIVFTVNWRKHAWEIKNCEHCSQFQKEHIKYTQSLANGLRFQHITPLHKKETNRGWSIINAIFLSISHIFTNRFLKWSISFDTATFLCSQHCSLEHFHTYNTTLLFFLVMVTSLLSIVKTSLDLLFTWHTTYISLNVFPAKWGE